MSRTLLKTTALAIVAAAALLAPAAQAGYGHRHHGFVKTYSHHHYGHRHVYTPRYVYVQRVTCKKYGWVWSHGHKVWGCVKTW